MRLPRPRFHLRPRLRLRTLLIAVAIAGLVLGGWQMWKRREYYLEKAARLERIAKFYRMFGSASPDQTGITEPSADRCDSMATRYRHVARYPWLPLPTEPNLYPRGVSSP